MFYTVLWNSGGCPWVQVGIKVVWVEKRVLRFGFSKSSGYLVPVFALVGGFCFSMMMPGLGGRVCFIGHVFKVLNRGLGTKLRDLFCALILFIAHVTECFIDRFILPCQTLMIWYAQDRKVAAKNICLKGKAEDKQFWKKKLKQKENRNVARGRRERKTETNQT